MKKFRNKVKPNKINGMGMKGFDKWKAENPTEWAMLEVTCGIP